MHVLPGPAGHNDDDGSLVKTCLGPGLGCNLGHKLLKSSFLFKVVTDSKSEAEPASQSRRLGPRQPEHSQLRPPCGTALYSLDGSAWSGVSVVRGTGACGQWSGGGRA